MKAQFLARLICVALCLSLAVAVIPPLASPAVAATTWYVDGALGTNDGSHGSGPGSAAFKTIQYAINDVRVVGGDTIIAAAGIYSTSSNGETFPITISKSLTLQGAQSGVDARGRVGAESQLSSPADGAVSVTSAVANITIDGFTITGGRGMVSIQATDVTFVNNILSVVSTASGGAANLLQIGGVWQNVTIRYNDISPTPRASWPGGTNGIRFLSSTAAGSVVIDNNYLHNASSAGLGLQCNNPSASISVTNNEISANGTDGGFVVNPVIGTLNIRYNKIHDNTGRGVNIAGGITGTPDINIDHNDIYNNVAGGVYNANTFAVDAACNWWGCTAGPGAPGCETVQGTVAYDPWYTSPSAEASYKSVNTATGTGTAIFTSSSGHVRYLNAVSDNWVSQEGKPAVVFPHGLFDFTLCCFTPGETVTITIELPSAVPIGTRYWKHGPTAANPTPHWYQIPMGDDNGDNVVTLTLVDGGLGDDDMAVNGVIVDQGGPSQPRPISLRLTGWGWCLAYKDVANVTLDLDGSMIPRDTATTVSDLYLTGVLSFNLSNRTDTFNLELRGTKIRSLFFLRQVSGGVQPLIAEFEGSWISDNASLNDYVACEGRLAIPAPNHVAKPYVFVLRTRDVDVPSREMGNYASNIEFMIQRATLCFDIVADRLADGGAAIKDLIGSVLTRAAVIVREVRKLGTPYLT